MPAGHEYDHNAPKGAIGGDRSLEQVGPEAGHIVCMARPTDVNNGLTFFSNRLCPFAHRSWWILLELGVPFDYVHVDMGGPRATENGKPGKFGKPPWYVRDVNPCGTVPALYDKGVPRFAVRGTFEDDNIGHYLISKYGADSELIPQDPVMEADVRFFIGWVSGLDLLGAGMRLLFQKDRTKAEVDAEHLRSIMREVNAQIVERSPRGPFFLGDKLTIADIHLAPFLDRWEATLHFFRNFELFPAGDQSLARLKEMLTACRERPAFQQTSQSAEYYIWAERRTRWNANLVGTPWSETPPNARL